MNELGLPVVNLVSNRRKILKKSVVSTVMKQTTGIYVESLSISFNGMFDCPHR